jgi:hypothetical protein
MERKTGILTVTREHSSPVVAKLYFREGRVAVCELEDLPDPRNELAIYFLIEWTAGTFSVESCEVTRDFEIKSTTNGLLMEGARRMDERDASA